MDLHKMIADLQAERDRLDHAILALERLSRGLNGTKRGRPPKWLQALTAQPESDPEPVALARAAKKG